MDACVRLEGTQESTKQSSAPDRKGGESTTCEEGTRPAVIIKLFDHELSLLLPGNSTQNIAKADNKTQQAALRCEQRDTELHPQADSPAGLIVAKRKPAPRKRPSDHGTTESGPRQIMSSQMPSQIPALKSTHMPSQMPDGAMTASNLQSTTPVTSLTTPSDELLRAQHNAYLMHEHGPVLRNQRSDATAVSLRESMVSRKDEERFVEGNGDPRWSHAYAHQGNASHIRDMRVAAQVNSS